MVMRRTGFIDIGLDGEAIAGSIVLAGREPFQYFHHFAVTAAQFQRTRFEITAVAAEYHSRVTKCLNGLRGNRDRHFDFVRHQFNADEHAGMPAAILVIQNDPRRSRTRLPADQSSDVRDDAFAFDIVRSRLDRGLLPDPDDAQILRIHRNGGPDRRHVGHGENGDIVFQRGA